MFVILKKGNYLEKVLTYYFYKLNFVLIYLYIKSMLNFN